MKAINYNGKLLNFWSWNGKITENELIWQLNDFANNKFDGVVIHARAGLEIPYMGEEWFRLYECAVKTAKQLSLDVWIYDEDGWPSGFGGGRVTAMGEEYHLKKLNYGFDKNECLKAHPIAAYRKISDNNFSVIDIEKSINGDLFFWYVTEPHYVDLLNPAVTKAFIKCTYEEYYKHFSSYFSETIKGFFTDEPQVGCPLPWSSTLSDTFEKITGKPLINSLWLLAINGEGYQSFRYNFFSTVSAGLKASFTSVIGEWCESHSVMMTGHFANEDGLNSQVAANSGVMAQYPFMQLPGIDCLGNRFTSPVLCKQVASAAMQCSEGSCLSESLGCCGWDVSFSDIIWLMARQSAMGITNICCHLSAYTIKGVRKRDYPGFFSYQTPWWDKFSVIKTWFSSINRLMSSGIRKTDVLVLSPLSTVMAEYNGKFSSERLSVCSSQYRLLLENLTDVQLDFEIGDQTIIKSRGSVNGNRFIVGNREYTTVFVPDCDSLDKYTASLLSEFSNNGGRVIFVNRRPAKIDFIETDIFSNIKGYDICNRRELIEKAIKILEINRYAVLIGKNHSDLCNHLIVRTVFCKDKRIIQILNNNRTSSVDGIIKIADKVSIVKFNCFTGETENISSFCGNGNTYAEISLNASENVVLEVTDRVEPKPTDFRPVTSQSLTPFEIIRTDKNCLTIDKARYKIGDEISEPMPVFKITEKLYNMAAIKGNLKAGIIYSFVADASCPANGLTLCFEDEAVSAVFVNGQKLKEKRSGWWLDKSIGEYDISSMLCVGQNDVQLDIEILSQKTNLPGEEIFETEKNRFFRLAEPESIYIRGSFDVKVKQFENLLYSFSVEASDFKLTKPKALKPDELTSQGMWFYRGDILLKYKIFKPGGSGAKLSVNSLNCPIAEWSIEDKSGLILFEKQKYDITEALRDGENIITLRLISTNKNLLGPHHHIKGKTAIVGANTFYGVYGFEDFVNPELKKVPTWTDSYSCIPFGCGGVNVEYYSLE